MEAAILIEGFASNGYIAGLSPEKVELAAQRALNKIAAKARTRADRAVREQIAFPARYLGPSAKRLWIETKASRKRLEAVVRGRGRPTSLATFSRDKVLAPGKRHKDGGVRVEVHKGQKKLIRRAFIMRLNNNNRGLAVRTNGGEPAGAYKPKKIGRNLFLLYGPSVNQALISAREEGIYEDLAPEILDALDAEFFRLVELEQKNAI